MPNTFLKPETIARTGLGLLRRELILPRLVTRLGIEDFRGAKNDTVNVRVPARLAARDGHDVSERHRPGADPHLLSHDVIALRPRPRRQGRDRLCVSDARQIPVAVAVHAGPPFGARHQNPSARHPPAIDPGDP